jgi:hypothetical protein
VKSNVGAGDGVFRIVVGLVVLRDMFGFDGHLWWLGLLGLVPLATEISGWCPIY